MQLTTTRQGFAPATITEAIQFSEMLSKSQMVPRAYQGKPEDIMVAVQWGYEIGLAPLQALQNISVINGKPSVYGDAAMALVQASSVCDGVDEYFENEGTANPIAVCVARRKGRNPVIARFSVEDAKRAGLWGKQGPWQSYPKRMMQMRARGFALRDAFPDVLKGLITAEEAQDYPSEAATRQAKDITPPARKNPLDAIAPPSAPILEPFTPPHLEEPPAMEEVPLEVLVQQAEEAGFEVIEVPEVTEVELPNEPAESAEPAAEPAAEPIGYPLMLPGKADPHSYHQTLDEWQDAYEDIADRTSMANKVPARDRMTKLRELREVNEETIKRVDSVKRIRHTANYSKRLKALGATQ
jgi:hypothetical protein